MAEKSKLSRHMGLFALLAYGVGDILGAGIYALVGPVAAMAGSYLWLSFAIALTVAVLTALSYSEMCSRFPKSGGAAYFSQTAFKKPAVGFLVGWLLLFVSVVSMATLSNAFHGYLVSLGLKIPVFIVVFVFLAIMALINFRGIQESSRFNILSTIIEVSGLLLVLGAGAYFLLEKGPTQSNDQTFSWVSVMKGAALAFYAFIGFEDLANVAEEVKQPEKNLPRAIMGSLTTAGIIYLMIGYTAVEVAGPKLLGDSSAPLTEVIRLSTLPIPLQLFAVIALFAVANTCLLNSVTGSRLLFGLAEQKLVPRLFGTVHTKFKTPYISIAFVTLVAAVLASIGSLSTLAGATSVLILLVFMATNLSLWKTQKTEPRRQGFRIPKFLPILAAIANLALIFAAPLESLLIACGIFVLGLGIWALQLKFGNVITESPQT